MTSAGIQPQTIRYGKYIFAKDFIGSLLRWHRVPSQRLMVEEFRQQYQEAFHFRSLKTPRSLEVFQYDAWTAEQELMPTELSAEKIPEAYVLVIPYGRVVGRHGTVDVPKVDTRLLEFEYPPKNLRGFAQQVSYGKLNPRYWKYVALNSFRQRFVPRLVRCPGRVAVLNRAGSHNYYHWCTEILPRLWMLIESGEQVDWYVLDCYATWQRESLAAMDIPLEKIIQPHATLHIEADELIVPSIESRQVMKQMATEIAGRLGVDVTNRNERGRYIFIERVNSRKLENSNEFFAWRRRYGFEDYQLEKMSLSDQIKLFSEAEIILGAHGAGLTNILYCHPGTQIVELLSQKNNRLCYPALSRMCGLRHVLIRARQSARRQDMIVPMQALEQVLTKATA